jgi:hypothetical protein
MTAIANTSAGKRATFDASLKMPADIEHILRRSCADCHSEATRWPWYAKIPPASWMVQRDVEEARQAMDFSAWSEMSAGKAKGILAASCADMESKRMPLGKYLLMHPSARMSAQEIRRFCEWSRGVGN